MKIKYGMPTLIEYNSIEDNILLCKNLSLDFIEINMTMPYCYLENNSISKLNKLKDKYNIEYVMYFPQEIDFGTNYPEIQKANLSLFKRYLEFGTKIGIEKINIHLSSGPNISLPNQTIWIYEQENKQYIMRLKNEVEKLVKTAYPYQIQVCVENPISSRFTKLVFFQLKDIEGLSFTYNVGSDAQGNFLLEPFFQQYSDKVKLMHLHDYDKENTNQVLFRGIINLYEKIEYAKKNDLSVVIKVKTVESLKRSVYNLKMRHLM